MPKKKNVYIYIVCKFQTMNSPAIIKISVAPTPKQTTILLLHLLLNKIKNMQSIFIFCLQTVDAHIQI